MNEMNSIFTEAKTEQSCVNFCEGEVLSAKNRLSMMVCFFHVRIPSVDKGRVSLCLLRVESCDNYVRNKVVSREKGRYNKGSIINGSSRVKRK